MIYSDLHTHTTFCDGKNTPEEMVKSAIEKGLKEIGLVIHSYTEFDTSYCVSLEGEKAFKSAVSALKEQYKDKIKVLLGVEQDLFSTHSTEGYDYVIGSSHYFFVNGGYYDVDRGEEYFCKVVKEQFNGDYYAAAENYYGALCTLNEKTNADIVGHFNLVEKFNRSNKYFDVNNPRYVRAYTKALDCLLRTKKPFELNVGAIIRGYADFPYPSKKMIDIIKANGGRLLLSSDAHNASSIAQEFDRFENLL